MSTTEVNFLLTAETGRLQTQLSRVESSIMRIFSYLRQFGVGEDLNKVIEKIQQLITLMRTLQITLMAVRLAMSPRGDWTAWAYAGSSALSIGFAYYDVTRH